MKISIILAFQLVLTLFCAQTNAYRRKTEIQRKVLDGLVRLITKKSFPYLVEEIKRYFKGENVVKKLIADVALWKQDRIRRIFKRVNDKVDAIESVLWLIFQTKSKPKGRPEWEWLNSDYDVTAKRKRRTKPPDGNQDYNAGNAEILVLLVINYYYAANNGDNAAYGGGW